MFTSLLLKLSTCWLHPSRLFMAPTRPGHAPSVLRTHPSLEVQSVPRPNIVVIFGFLSRGERTEVWGSWTTRSGHRELNTTARITLESLTIFSKDSLVVQPTFLVIYMYRPWKENN